MIGLIYAPLSAAPNQRASPGWDHFRMSALLPADLPTRRGEMQRRKETRSTTHDDAIICSVCVMPPNHAPRRPFEYILSPSHWVQQENFCRILS